MPNLSDFLKCEKVRCVCGYEGDLTIGKEYTILEVKFKVIDDEGERFFWESDNFEPVLETAIQATNALDDTPMGTRTVNEFEIGNPVYYKNEPKIHIIQGIDENDNTVHFGINGKYGFEWWTAENLVLATPENYEMLCKLYPHIEFEAPKRELTGSDLCRAMLDKGWKYVLCYVDGKSEKITDLFFRAITKCDGDWFYTEQDSRWAYAVPFDPKTGNVLTSEVLDD